MKIKVEQRHIDAGERGSSCNCPVALAIQEVTGSAAFVNPKSAYVDGRIKRIPESVKEFVYYFDYGKPVSPFEFDINIK